MSKKEIQQLGWTFSHQWKDTDRDINYLVFTKQTDKAEYKLQLSDELLITAHYKDNYNKPGVRVIFEGTINNKSELKKLESQLGIHDTPIL